MSGNSPLPTTSERDRYHIRSEDPLLISVEARALVVEPETDLAKAVIAPPVSNRIEPAGAGEIGPINRDAYLTR